MGYSSLPFCRKRNPQARFCACGKRSRPRIRTARFPPVGLSTSGSKGPGNAHLSLAAPPAVVPIVFLQGDSVKHFSVNSCGRAGSGVSPATGGSAAVSSQAASAVPRSVRVHPADSAPLVGVFAVYAARRRLLPAIAVEFFRRTLYPAMRLSRSPLRARPPGRFCATRRCIRRPRRMSPAPARDRR